MTTASRSWSDVRVPTAEHGAESARSAITAARRISRPWQRCPLRRIAAATYRSGSPQLTDCCNGATLP